MMKRRRRNGDSTPFRQENIESNRLFSWRCRVRRDRHILERNLGDKEDRWEESQRLADRSKGVRLEYELSASVVVNQRVD